MFSQWPAALKAVAVNSVLQLGRVTQLLNQSQVLGRNMKECVLHK